MQSIALHSCRTTQANPKRRNVPHPTTDARMGTAKVQGYLSGNTDDPEGPTNHFRGWLVGELDRWANGDAEKECIASKATLLTTQLVGVKFQTEPRGKAGPAYSDVGDGKITLALLIAGELRIKLVSRQSGREHTEFLRNTGDYLVWPSSTYSHSWEALEDSTVVTVRWPELGSPDAPHA